MNNNEMSVFYYLGKTVEHIDYMKSNNLHISNVMFGADYNDYNINVLKWFACITPDVTGYRWCSKDCVIINLTLHTAERVIK